MNYSSDEDEIMENGTESEMEMTSDTPHRRRILRHTAVLPSVFTLMNGLCGLGAIYIATRHGVENHTEVVLDDFKIAAFLICLAMVCDMLDGRLARMMRSTSDFGAQLDSLCDVVSFGVAPAILTLRCSLSLYHTMPYLVELPVERIYWCISGIYLSCAVLRLARFNVESDHAEESHLTFRGLPSPGAAACLTIIVLLYIHLVSQTTIWPWLSLRIVQYSMSIVIPVLTLICALLMVSRFKYIHLANQYVRGSKPFGYLVKLVFLIFLLIPALIEPYGFLAVGMLVYALSGPAGSLIRLLKRSD